MSNLAHRQGNIQNTSGVAQSGWYVTAYEVGAVVSTAANSSTITVDAGHGFAAGDKILINPGSDDTFSGTDTVQSTTSSTVVMGQAYDVSVGDVLVNLGADTGTSTPNYDASGVTIYSDMDGVTSVTSSTLTTGSDGEYHYWHSTAEIWELVRNSSGSPQEVKYDVVTGDVVAPSSSTDSAIVRFDGTTGKKIQDYTSGAPTIGDTGAVTIGQTLDVTGTLTAGGELEIDGDLNHDGSNVGFYGVSPAARPSAYTQTYSTADKTHANPTASALTDSTSGSADQTLSEVTDQSETTDNSVINDNFAELADEVNKLITDLADLKQLVNSVIDDLQTLGLFQ